eukprot:TRINITY_DN64914_c0_g4_i1.p1 TRINITY_DN64914_c0_g4~~TRINITY_DN64914_c0_g4_i1.p1  ORF type:complete len:596 (+),score=113.19 TRINITY_DN64914_c0_g4_i1:69-1856(+)
MAMKCLLSLCVRFQKTAILLLATCLLQAATRAEAAAAKSTFAEQVSRLRAWIEAHGGAIHPSVGIVQHALESGAAAEGSDRGLSATEEIKEGEMLLRIPRQTLVPYFLAGRDPLAAEAKRLLEEERTRCVSCSTSVCRKECRVISEASPEAVQQITIALWLSKELKNASSWYSPWLEMLPPMDATGNGAALLLLAEPYLQVALKGTELLKEVVALQETWRLAYGILNASSQFRDEIGSYESFASSRVLVLSRTHGLSYTGVDSAQDTMVPFADLLNHDPDPPTGWEFDASKDAFTLSALRRLPPGTPIECSYGTGKSNNELFIHYGFILPANAAHSVLVPVELGDSRRDPLFAVKRAVLLEMEYYRTFRFGVGNGFAASGRSLRGLTSGVAEISADPAKAMMAEVLTYLRVASVGVEDIEKHPILSTGFLEQDLDAIETLRQSYMAMSTDLESRASGLLVESAQTALNAMCSGESCQPDAMLAEMTKAPVGAAGVADVSSLRHVAVMAAKHVALEKLLYQRLLSVGQAVRQFAASKLLEGGENAPPPLDDLVEKAALPDAESKALLRAWLDNFRQGYEVLHQRDDWSGPAEHKEL